MNITIDIPDMATIVLPAALYRAEIERERSAATHALQQELDALKAERREMVDALNIDATDNPAVAVAALVTERDNARAEIAELERSNTAQANVIKELSAKLEALKEPPVKPDDTVPIVLPTDPVIKPPAPELPQVPTVPDPPTPEPVQKLHGTGFTITLGLAAPSLQTDTVAGELMRMGAAMGFRWTRFFRNKDEAAKDVERAADDPRNLYALAGRLNLKVAADTIDVIALRLSDGDLEAYLGRIEKLGARLLVFNDADQYRTAKNADGSLKYTPGTLERLVERVRKFSKLPIMASLTATAALGAYDFFDYTEAQTFGRIGELDDFLKRPFDAFCLDAQASVSADYLMKAHDVVMQFKPPFVWYYTALDKATDWRQMPEKTRIIEGTVKALNEKHTAQQG